MLRANYVSLMCSGVAVMSMLLAVWPDYLPNDAQVIFGFIGLMFFICAICTGMIHMLVNKDPDDA